MLSNTEFAEDISIEVVGGDLPKVVEGLADAHGLQVTDDAR